MFLPTVLVLVFILCVIQLRLVSYNRKERSRKENQRELSTMFVGPNNRLADTAIIRAFEMTRTQIRCCKHIEHLQSAYNMLESFRVLYGNNDFYQELRNEIIAVQCMIYH